MSNLDNMLNNQQKQGKPIENKNSLLKKISRAYLWIGNIAIMFGIFLFLFGLNKAGAIGVGIGIIFGGLFTIFMGCVGEAIDDIRNNIKKIL